MLMSSGRVFQTRGPATVKTLLPTVESLPGGTIRLLELAERNGLIRDSNQWCTQEGYDNNLIYKAPYGRNFTGANKIIIIFIFMQQLTADS